MVRSTLIHSHMVLIVAGSQDVSMINLSQGLYRVVNELELVHGTQERQLVSRILTWQTAVHLTILYRRTS